MAFVRCALAAFNILQFFRAIIFSFPFFLPIFISMYIFPRQMNVLLDQPVCSVSYTPARPIPLPSSLISAARFAIDF